MAIQSDVATPRSIFLAAIMLPDEQARQMFVDLACRDDASLKEKVCKLLVARPLGEASPIDAAVQFDTGQTALSAVEAAERSHEERHERPFAPTAEPLDLSTHPQIGPYKLLEQIGQGGMGAVYMAQQSAPVKREVALKIIKPGMDSKEVIARFEAERQALAMMDHPHIARVFDGGTTAQGRPYFVMELVRGVPIIDYCREKKVGLDERLKLFIDVCRAVQHAHQKGIIHRDLKPSNILITLHDGVPVVKVIDFGVAKALNQELTERTLFTHFSQMIGTPLYMAPEQAEMSGLDIDTRSDVYSLGVVLYELLTGTTPFDRETISKLGFDGFRKVLKEQEPPRPSVRLSTLKAANLSTLEDQRQLSTEELTRKLQRELDWIVMKALEKDRERRYESATALAADVQRYLDNEPVQACPPTLGYRIAKFVRRNRSRVVTGLVSLVALSIIAGMLLQGHWTSARRALEAAQAVESSLASAKTAIETRSLGLAEQNLVEARTRLDLVGTQRAELEQQIALIQADVEQGKVDEKKFAEFVSLARKAQDTLSYGGDDIELGPVDAQNALGLFGVLDKQDWAETLKRSQLSQEQQERVRETAYETLLLFADSKVRWEQFKSGAAAREGQTLLETAQAFHEPTKALYWVRKEIHQYLKDETVARSDQALYDSTPAKTAWDWYLPGHTAGWRGDRKAAIAAYENALRIQPNHYNSLFFLGDRLAADKRYGDALGYYAACIALRPEHIYPYLNRAENQLKMGNQAAAEADYRDAVTSAQSPRDVVIAQSHLLDFYYRTNQHEQRIATAQQLAADSRSIVDKQVAKFGDDSAETQKVISILGGILSENKQTDAAIPLLRRSLERRRRLFENKNPLIAISLNKLGFALVAAGQFDEAVPLLEESLQVCRATHGPHHSDTLVAMSVLGDAYTQAGKLDEAIQLLEQARDQVKSATKVTGYTIMRNLGDAYGFASRWSEAVAAQSDALDRSKALWGAEDLRTLMIMYKLGDALVGQGHSEQAIPYLEESSGKFRRLLGEQSDETLNSVQVLIIAYANSNRAEECKKQINDQYKLIRETNEGVSLANWEAGATNSLLKVEAYDDAEPLAQHCLELRQKLLPGTWQAFNAQSQLGGVLLGQEKLDEAEPLLLEAIAGLDSQRDQIPLEARENVTDTLKRLVTLYEAKSDPEEAARWADKLPAEELPDQPIPK